MAAGPQNYLAGACELLDAYGPAVPGIGMTATAMAVAGGVSRASVYRHWPSVLDLNDDLATFAIRESVGWQRRILDRPVSEPFGVALAAALDGDEHGLWYRCSLRTWPDGARVRREAEAWEGAWLEALAAWLDRHLAAHDLRYRSEVGGRIAALALAVLVEGVLLLDRVWSEPGADEWFTGRTLDLAVSADRLLAALTEPGAMDPPAGGDAEPPELPGMDVAGAKRSLLERALAASAAAGIGEPAAPTPGRLVDPARLARRLEVTERRVFDVWPTATAENTDLVTALGDRAVATFEAVADATLSSGLAPDDRPYSLVSTEAFDLYIRSAATPGRVHMFQCTPVLRDPEVRTAFIATTASAATPMRRTFLALLWMSGDDLRPEVSIDEYLGTFRAAVGGAQRLLTAQPALADERLHRGGHDHPALGLACSRVIDTLVERISRPEL